MKATATRTTTPPAFQPVRVELILESQAEVNALYALFAIVNPSSLTDLINGAISLKVDPQSITVTDVDRVAAPLFDALFPMAGK